AQATERTGLLTRKLTLFSRGILLPLYITGTTMGTTSGVGAALPLPLRPKPAPTIDGVCALSVHALQRVRDAFRLEMVSGFFHRLRLNGSGPSRQPSCIQTEICLLFHTQLPRKIASHRREGFLGDRTSAFNFVDGFRSCELNPVDAGLVFIERNPS